MKHVLLMLVVGLLVPTPGMAEPLGSGFTYQGELSQSDMPASGSFDFEFGIYGAAEGGVSLVAPIQIEDVPVTDGLFTVELDFGQTVFDGDQLWIGVGVRDGGSKGEFTALSPRQKVTAAPYSLHALNTTQGNQASSQFLGFTSESINGNNSYVGMALLCEADFPGSTVCSTDDLVGWDPPPDPADFDLDDFAWMHVDHQTVISSTVVMDEATGFVFTDGTPPAEQVSLTCQGWRTVSNDYVAFSLHVVSATETIEWALRQCGNLQPVACCSRGQ